MTDAQRIYRSIVDFIDQQTAGLPPEIGLKMVRSYASILAEPERPTFRQMPGAPLGVIGRTTHGWLAAPTDAEILDAHLAGPDV